MSDNLGDGCILVHLTEDRIRIHTTVTEPDGTVAQDATVEVSKADGDHSESVLLLVRALSALDRATTFALADGLGQGYGYKDPKTGEPVTFG